MIDEPTTSTLSGSLAMLRADLTAISQKLTNGASPKEHVSAMGASINVVIDFLNVTIRDPEATKVMLDLLGELADIREGQGSDLFDTVPKQWDTHTKPLYHETMWAQAAACVTLLNENGTQLDEATKKVAYEFELQNFPLPGPKDASAGSTLDLAKRLKDWRTRLRKSSSKMKHRPYLVHVHDKAVKNARENCGDHAADCLMEILRQDLKRRSSA